MNRDFLTDTNEITKLAASIFAADTTVTGGRATYLRSLLAATQVDLAGKPIQRLTGRPKRLDIDTAAKSFEKVNEAFYGAVLAAVPEGLNPKERQSKTSFARSASATLRRAIKAGWNPLGTAVGAVTKAGVAAWTKAHSEPRAPSVGAIEGRVVRGAEKLAGLLSQIPPTEAARIRAIALEALENGQKLTNVSVRRHPPERIAAH